MEKRHRPANRTLSFLGKTVLDENQQMPPRERMEREARDSKVKFF